MSAMIRAADKSERDVDVMRCDMPRGREVTISSERVTSRRRDDAAAAEARDARGAR